MRTLEQALSEHELVVLRVIGEWWELDLTGADKPACVKLLNQTLAAVNLPQEASYMPPEETAAIYALVQEGGRMPVASFSRQHGEVRPMGPGRLEREEPWYDPVSPAEALWYRGLLYRGFDETASGLVEFYYLPDELFQQFPQEKVLRETSPGRLPPIPAPPAFNEATADAVDDLTTILALAQMQGAPFLAGLAENLRPYLLNSDPSRCNLLFQLALEMELLRKGEEGVKPTRAAVAWLQKSREEQLRDLADAWSSSVWNELRHTPGLVCEGSGWANDPIQARATFLDTLPRDDGWLSLADLVAHVKANEPDFQRPDGNYDTWYIRDVELDVYLAGFESWDRVEGRLLRFLAQGPLYWLGLVETARASDLFRLTPRALAWLADQKPTAHEVTVPLVVRPEATLLVPHNANRYQRFQAARIAEMEPAQVGQPYVYCLTPHSLAQAQQQGITPDKVLAFLEKASGRPLPPSVKRAVERWAERGVEGRLQHAVILRVRDPDILEKLRANPKTRPYIGESLGDLSVTIRPSDYEPLRQAAAQLGLLLDREGGQLVIGN